MSEVNDAFKGVLTVSNNPDTQQNPDENADFSYDGYQVVRGEFFAHLFEPSVSFKNEKVSVNAACLRKLPETEYVQFLVNPTEKMLAVKPCREEDKDSFQWASGEGKKRKPKTITCRIFYAKLMNLMNWNPQYRYKILGKLVRTATDTLFVFDLSSAQTFISSKKDDPNSRKAMYPEEWKNQFGVPYNDHQNTMNVSIFDDYAVFRINRDEEEKKEDSANEDNLSTDLSGSEETTNSDSQADAATAEQPTVHPVSG